MDILAGQTQDLRYDPQAKAFKPANDILNDSPIFTIRTLDYWQWLSVTAITDGTEQTRVCCQLGLVAVDGDEGKAKSFLERPKLKLIAPLTQAIVDAASGN